MSIERLEVYNESESLVLSSRWPSMNMYAYAKNAQIIYRQPYLYYAEIAFDKPRRNTGLMAWKPREVGLFGEPQQWSTGPWGDSWFPGVRFVGYDWFGTGRPGSVDFYMFEFESIPSGERFGLQTFDENGKLTFDSESTSIKILRQVKFEDMTFLGGHAAGTGDGYMWYYGIQWHPEADAVIQTSNPKWQSGGEGSSGSWGFKDDMNTFVYAYHWRTTWGPPVGFRTPGLMFCKLTKKLP